MEQKTKEVLIEVLDAVLKALNAVTEEVAHRHMIQAFDRFLTEAKASGDPQVIATARGFITDEELQLELAQDQLSDHLRQLQKIKMLLEGRTLEEIRAEFAETDRRIAEAKERLEAKFQRGR